MASYRQAFFFFYISVPVNRRESLSSAELQRCEKHFFFFWRLISFDNSLSGGIGGLVVGSAICSSLSSAPALFCCQESLRRVVIMGNYVAYCELVVVR